LLGKLFHKRNFSISSTFQVPWESPAKTVPVGTCFAKVDTTFAHLIWKFHPGSVIHLYGSGNRVFEYLETYNTYAHLLMYYIYLSFCF